MADCTQNRSSWLHPSSNSFPLYSSFCQQCFQHKSRRLQDLRFLRSPSTVRLRRNYMTLSNVCAPKGTFVSRVSVDLFSPFADIFCRGQTVADLPRIILLGNQSAGKSSLVTAIAEVCSTWPSRSHSHASQPDPHTLCRSTSLGMTVPPPDPPWKSGSPALRRTSLGMLKFPSASSLMPRETDARMCARVGSRWLMTECHHETRDVTCRVVESSAVAISSCPALLLRDVSQYGAE